MTYKIIVFIIKYSLKPICYVLLSLFKTVIIFRFGNSLGDYVYMSSILREINLKKKRNIILFTKLKEFYVNNPRIKILIKSNYGTIISFLLNSMKGKLIMDFNSIHSNKSNKHFLYYHKKNIHIAQAMSEHFSLNLDYSNLKNEFFLTEEEKKNFNSNISLPKKFSLIHSQSKQSFTKNKEWKQEGLQDIIDYFDNINWIQVGKSEEPRLKNCKYFFDLPLRELAFIISRCEFIVCYEGFFNHLASCFDKKTFLIHTGFLPIESFKYNNNLIIHNNTKIKCYPCYDLVCEQHQENVKQNFDSEFVLTKMKNNLIQ